ncbi:MAG: HAD family hydrolase [Halanaeroarchaeum sp.]
MHVVFDLDGVLLDSESDLSWLDSALEETLESFGLEPNETNRRALFPPSRAEMRELAETAGVSIERLWAVRNRNYVDAKVSAIETGQIGPYPDVGVVEELSRRFPVGIVSNSPQIVVETFLDETGLTDIVDEAIGRGMELADVDRLKPDPHLYERFHEAAAGNEYVYVGDEPSDREFAERTGMDFVHLDRENGPVATLYDVQDRLDDTG